LPLSLRDLKILKKYECIDLSLWGEQVVATHKTDEKSESRRVEKKNPQQLNGIGKQICLDCIPICFGFSFISFLERELLSGKFMKAQFFSRHSRIVAENLF